MLKVFLAFSFRPQDEDFVRRVEALLESHGVQVVTGEVLGGQVLTPAVKKRINESDAVVALLTRRDKLVSGRWSTHDWVRDELSHARTKKKPAIAVVDVAVDVGGVYQEHERVDFDPKRESLALLKLSQTVGEWKHQFGSLVKVRILPDALGQRVAAIGGKAKCEFRLTRQGRTTKWFPASSVPEPGGTYAYVRGADEDALIQLRVRLPNETWISPAAPQWMDATLSKAGVG